jgi:hypothetical protein
MLNIFAKKKIMLNMYMVHCITGKKGIRCWSTEVVLLYGLRRASDSEYSSRLFWLSLRVQALQEVIR